jgi:hypothetical protein
MRKVKKWSRSGYVTDDFVEAAYYAIYNNLDVDDVVEDEIKTSCEILDDSLEKGEEYVILDGMHSNFCLSNYGRVFNCKLIRQQSVRFYDTGIYVYLNKVKLDVPVIFQEQGWDYSLEQLLRNYKKYKWRHADLTNKLL